jgi:diguanylate cyclase (GGDEF)-like protein/PAS domain S-box-containing protein
MSQAESGASLKVSTGFLVYSFLHVPLLSKGKVLGVLSVDNRSGRRAFTDSDEVMLTSLADYATVAIENANLYHQMQQELFERRKVEEALRQSDERYALAVRGASDGLWDWDLKTGRVYFSPRWKSMLGYQENEISSNLNEWFSRIHAEDIEQAKLDISNHIKGLTSHYENEHRMLHKDGSYRWMLSRGLAVWGEDGIAKRMAGSMTDMTDRKVAEQRLQHDALHDTLTGLPNRALLMDRLGLAVERAKRREGFLFAVLFLDLDRFKDINDSLGHMVGDKLLVAVARMLENHVRPTDTVARQGGDEFVILLEDIKDINDATRVADRVQKEVGECFVMDEHPVFISASIGIVLSMTGYTRHEDVLRDADIAMYRAKANGKARYEIFDPAMRSRIMERLSLEAELRRALENEELRLYYQPIVSLESSKVTGFEALIRWQHPVQGLLLPVDFISLAEETGLIIPVGQWVLHEACRQMHEWQQLFPNHRDLTISVNISGKQVAQPEFHDQINKILDETGLDPSSLKLELTESAIIENIDLTIPMFNRLREMGVQIQIDDFGMGYSSLNYLSVFPINALKIGQSFISMMTNDENNRKIVNAIVMLTHGLGMGVIAEGVESRKQLDQLRSLGCEYGQGYLISMPLDQGSVSALLAKGYTGPLPPLRDNSS